MGRRSRNAEEEEGRRSGGTEEAGSAEREGMKDVLKKNEKGGSFFSRSCAAGRAETAASW
jgi:hypothetical protein